MQLAAKLPANSPGAIDVSCQHPHQQALVGEAVQSGVVTVQPLVHELHGPAPSGTPPEMYWYCRSNGAIGAAVESLARPTIRCVLPSAARNDAPMQLPPPSDPPPDELPVDASVPPLLPLPLPLLPPLPLAQQPPLLPPLPPPLLPPASPAVAPPFEPLLQLGTAATASNPATMRLHARMSQSLALAMLVGDVDLLCLDAGNTVVFFDHARLASLAARAGFATTAGALVVAEGEAKLALERGETTDVAWSGAAAPAARGWAATVGSILTFAGAPRESLPRLLDALWPEHVRRNLWSLVPAGLVEALGRARARGAKVAVVSNSEGMLEGLFRDLGVLGALDLVVDSGVVGVEKPDPRIFHIALERFGIPASRALHLGDNYATDVLGARAAGVRVALVDPYGHLAGKHLDVPRVPGAAEVADALAGALARRMT